MTTDTSEKGLETLIVRHMTGTDGLAVAPNTVAERPPPYGGTGYTAGSAQDYDRAHALDVPQLFAFLRATQPEAFKKLGLADANDPKDINRLKFLARLSGEIGKRGVIDVLRKGVEHPAGHFDLFYGTPSPGNAKAETAARREPFLDHAPARLQHGRDAPRARPVPVHQRPAHRHLRAEEQPHQADGRGRRPAVQARPRPARAAVRVRPLRGALRGGRQRGADVHRAARQGLVVPALQQGPQRRRGQPAQPARPQDRLPVERGAHAGGADQHPRELRADRRGERPAHRQEEAQAGVAALPPARRGAAGAGRCARPRRGPALPDPALGGQRQVELHRLAGAPAHRPEARRRCGRRGDFRLGHRGHRPAPARRPDPDDHQAVHAGGRDRGARRALGRPAQVHPGGQEDHRLDGAEVPLHPRRDRDRGRQDLRHRHRRGAFEPGRQDLGGDEPGARRTGGRRRTRGPTPKTR